MKNMKIFAVVAVIGVAVGGLALAQSQHSGTQGHSAAHHHADPASVVQHLSEVFPKVASFDANKDGKLDDAEKQSLAKAIADGTLQLPAHTPPNGAKHTPEMMPTHIGEMYAQVASYDTNHDGALDATEQAALKKAIEKGEFDPHGQHQHDAGELHH